MRCTALISLGPNVPGIVVILLAAALATAAPARAVDVPGSRATLKGLTAIRVAVERMRPDAEADGLTTSQLKTDIELRLRQAGIRLSLSSAEFLLVNVNTKKNEELDLYAYVLNVDLIQPVSLMRDPKTPAYAATWSVGVFGVVGADRLRGLRSDVADLVDRFINAYLEQNPKQ